ncbi:Low temperature viability protein [Cryphonectria parasitica EP155]|uniref:Low temperature viability protein n=1 Tax=Cryphonectria parasitica (strain ATCC 38755 / EP155) TaxID=660469 RepID=A0A9P4YC77_CRYP1|nr:Low temperature viability protein [Cryphonectria parasitica EP155]KAF3770668.1 Low temperature viability protein [Cryphonectria parasitica EP155]
MPPSNWQKAKKAGTAQHFTLVHRPQNDPRINDESAPSMVLNPTQQPNSSKIKKLDDLASELGSDAQSIRDNEGEAANYGIYFDDTEYDYMQHMREIGTGGGEAVFVEAKAPQNKGKGKQSLEEALKQMELEQKSGDLLDEDILPSKDLQRLTYQSQQDIPDAIAGFQPDMDPRLREVLEALEDDAYVDDDEDIFQALSKDAGELNRHEFEETYDEYEDDGWESDHTAKPTKEYQDDDEVPALVNTAETPEQGPSQDWLENFKQFKKDQKTEKKPAGPSPMDGQSSMWTTTTMGARKKKRKGALTNPSAYSMTSSSLMRNEQLTILDARFDKMEERYGEMDDEEEGSIVSGMSSMSSIQGPMRQDFDGILDEFLGSHKMQGKRRVKRGKDQSGVQELDEIRKGLGPARIKGRSG